MITDMSYIITAQRFIRDTQMNIRLKELGIESAL